MRARRLLRPTRTSVYDRVCDDLDDAIAGKFGFTFPLEGTEDYQALKDADERALLVEARKLLPEEGAGVEDYLGAERVEELERRLLSPCEPMPPEAARRRFLEVHQEAERQVARASELTDAVKG